MPPSEFKDRLRAAIQRAGLTQAEAADKIGCSSHSVTYWLAGGQPRLPKYKLIVAAFPEIGEPEPAAEVAS